MPLIRLAPLLRVAVALSPLATQPAGAQNLPRILLRTDLGNIVIEVDGDRAPVTAANVLKYVDMGFYTDGAFHRTVTPDNQGANQVKIEVVQASIDPDRAARHFGPIKLERTSVTNLRHRDGTVSMARRDPDSAIADFFICIGDQPELDFGGKRNPDGQGFAAFGRVVAGMDVVRRIQRQPANDRQQLTPPIRILEATRTP
ncbi:MAG: peptidylprolyl isomerase [Gemmatimonadetes bacterium]|nr:peptidylprolyl isomerase [Gemmatimonadota bacterium]